MADPSATISPLRWGGSPPHGGSPHAEANKQLPVAETLTGSRMLKVELIGSSSRSSSSSPPPPGRAPRPRRPHERAAARGTTVAVGRRSAVALPCCTPTPTPTVTPSQTPSGTPTRSPPGKGLRGDSSSLPPVPGFSSRFSPACASAKAATAKKGGRSPFAGQGAPFTGDAGSRTGGDRNVVGEQGGGVPAGGAAEPGRVQRDQTGREGPSIESEVTGMLDESKGTLRLARDGLGDERVPSLTLERLKEMYRTGRGSVCSWRATASSANRDQGGAVTTAVIKVEQGRLGVLSSHEAYLVEFKETAPSSSAHVNGPARQLTRVDEEGEFQLVYLWVGARAGVDACEAARAQGKRLLEQHSSSASRTPLLEVEQGCEPALFLGLFSYMLPPLAPVVLQGRDEAPDLRVLELQESPCLKGSGIVIAVEGPCSASLLAQHGPLPGRSYICLVRPRRGGVGCVKDRGGVDLDGGGSVGTFDAAYYWHGVGEAPAVEEVGILLCQQVDRMFTSPSPDDRGRKKGGGRRRRRPDGVGLGGGMMRGYVADVKLGLPVPDGFWACLLPERPTSSSVFASNDRRLLSQDLRPECRSRPVRVFGVCGGSKKARQSFVWEVTCGGMPSQMRLSPSLSHVVDAGASRVYVWHGIGSSRDDRRLAWQVASAYAARVQGGVSVEQADAGSEPVGLLDCFIGWNQALVEPPPMLSLSPGRRHSELESSADWSSLPTPTSTEGKDSTRVGRHDQRRCGHRSYSRGASSGSMSSGSRLTPPGQRTPSLSLASPPSLKHGAGGVDPSLRRCAAGPEGLPVNLEAFPPPPRQPAATCGSMPGCGSCASPPCLLGFTACVDAFTADRTTLSPRPHGGAAPSASSSSAVDRSDDDNSSRDDAVHPRPGAAAGKCALPDLERNSRCAGGERGEGGDYPMDAVQTCDGGHGEGGEGNHDTRRGPSGDGGRGNDGKTDDDAGESGWGGNQEEGGPGERQGDRGGEDRGEGGGGESEDDGEGSGSNGSGAQGMGSEEIEEDEDGEEDAEDGEGEEMDTFLRLSEVDFCEELDVLQLGRTSTAGRDSSIGGKSGGVGDGGDEIVRVIPRHLSDFFRSPLALDSTPKRRLSPKWSLSDVQTCARPFDSVKSPGSDDDGALRVSGSGNLFIPAFSSAVGGTAAQVANSVLINCAGSPPSSVPPAAAGAAAGTPDTSVAAAIAAPPSDETGQTQAAAIDELPAETSVLCEPTNAEAEISDGPRGPEEPEAAEQPDCGHPDGSIGDDSGGGDSEEEWLTGDVVEPALEKRGDNSRSPNLNPISTATQEAAPKADRAAATVGTQWAGLNDDGSWRTEVARRAAGKAGEVEAERRRLAKIIADESWRSDAGLADGAGRRGGRNARRESVVRLQSGNVRNKLNAFQGSPGSNAGKETTDNRSSIGALHGRGLVSAWAKKCTAQASAAATAQAVPPSAPDESGANESLCHGDDPPTPSAEGRARPSPTHVHGADEQSDEFVWKAGPAPCRLQGRPSLGLIRNGQVRIMTKALLLSCPEGGDDEAAVESAKNCEQAKADVNHDGNSSGRSIEPPVPSSPPPPPPRGTEGTPPPLPERPSPGGSSSSPGKRPLPARPLPARPLPAQPSAGKGNFWLAKAGLTRKKRDVMSPASAPATPPRNGVALQRGGGTLTPPPAYAAGRTGGGVAAAAKVLDAIGARGSPSGGASGAWAKLRRRLEVEGQNLSGEGRSEAMSSRVAGPTGENETCSIVTEAP